MSKKQTGFRFPIWMIEKMKENKARGLGSATYQLQSAWVEKYMPQGEITDRQRLDWLANPTNKIGAVMLPVKHVLTTDDLRAAIDEVMRDENTD